MARETRVRGTPVIPAKGTLSRRGALAALGSGFLLPLFASCAQMAPRHGSAGGVALAEPLYFSSVQALADAIRRREVSAREVVEAHLARIDEVNDELNAVFQLQREAAIARAREADAALARGGIWGPLHGVPMTIKDSLDTAGVITTGGTMGRANFVPPRDATVVARLYSAGAILLGKTNTPEFTLSFETDNLVYGPTNNPFDVRRSPGGSSGGAAAIVAAGGAPFDIGSDYGGSIRLPAHFCGIAGVKPSAGRVPRTGHVFPFGGLTDSWQQIGPLARYVDDLTLLLELIAGPDGIDPGVVPLVWRDPSTVDVGQLRVSFHTDNGIATPTAETRETVERIAGLIESTGAAVEEARPSGIERTMDIVAATVQWDGGAGVARLLREAGTTEHTLQGWLATPPLDAVQLDEAITRWYAFRSEMHSFMARYDAIVCPVNATPAPMHGPALDDLPNFSYTLAYNATGWPGAVVRAGVSAEGLPIGVQIVAAPGREDICLALAKLVEAEGGGYQRPGL